MEFSVEAPAETAPLTATEVFRVLKVASSSDQQQVQSSTKQLQNWETTQGYYQLLQDAFIDSNLPIEVRMQAIIQLKNGIDKYWRKSAQNAIRPEERSTIRSRLLATTIDQDVKQLVNMNAIVTAKIARFDFPAQWSTLVNELIDLLRRAGSEQQLTNSLQLTLQVIKELSTVRIQRSRFNLFSVAPELFYVLRDLYVARTQEWMQALQSNTGDSVADARTLLFSMSITEHVLKIIRRLIMAGYEFPHMSSEIQQFWMLSEEHLQAFLNKYHASANSQPFKDLLGRHIVQVAKLHWNMADGHPVSFALLPETTALVHYYWSAAKSMRDQQIRSNDDGSEDEYVFETFNLKALMIVRACFKTVFQATISTFKFKSNDKKDQPDRAKTLIRTQILSDEFLGDLFDTVLYKFFVHTPSDMEEWIGEPEEWEMREEGDEAAYDRSVRPCAERLFLDLSINYRSIITSRLSSVVTPILNNPNEDVLLKDAMYTAIGIAAPVLDGNFDFNDFLATRIVAELQAEKSLQSILRRRIAIVIAQWITVNIADEHRPLIYQIFDHLLDPSVQLNNQALRITVAKRLETVIEEWQFQPQPFAQHAPRILSRLIDMVHEVTLPETKLALLNTVSVIIDKMESQIGPFANQLITMLPPLWAASGQENLMKQSIVTVLTKMVSALKAESAPLHPVVLPIIREAIQPGSETQVYLLENCLELWAAIVVQTPRPASQELLSMVQYLLPVLEMEEAYVEKGLSIAESYLLLAPTELLRDDFRNQLLASFTSLLKAKKDSIVRNVCRCIELMIRAAHSLGGNEAISLVAQSLWEAQLFDIIFGVVKQCWEAEQTTGPTRKEPPRESRNLTDYFMIASRIIMASTPAWFDIISKWAAEHDGETGKEPLPWFLDQFFTHMDSVVDPVESKLMTMGLTNLLQLPMEMLYLKLQDYLALWTTEVIDLRDGDDESSDSLVFKPDTTDGMGDMSPEAQRRTALTTADPAHCINIQAYIRDRLLQTIEEAGGMEAFKQNWLVNVDADVVKAFEELKII